MLLTFARPLVLAALFAGLSAVAEAQGPPHVASGALPTADRPFGTLREQASMQHAWLKKRLDTFLPALMRKHGVDLWVVPMREYNEDPGCAAVRATRGFSAQQRGVVLCC